MDISSLVQEVNSLSQGRNPQQLATDSFIVLMGMLFLCFYGMAHFNTPEYRLSTLKASDNPGLLTLAPPKYTTTRSRFRRYAWWYVLILQCFFVVIVVFPTLFVEAAAEAEPATIGALSKFLNEPLFSRAIGALFLLTGLVPSIPGLKSVDTWLLAKLHAAALR